MAKNSKGSKKKAQSKVSFESSNEVVMKYGPNEKSFLQLARTKVNGGESPDKITLSKGYFDKDGEKKFSKGLMIPDDKKVFAWIKKEISKR